MSKAEGQMLAALSRRYQPPGWAFLSHVANGTGANKSRTMDALAMGLWPSRGLELFGFELKAGRGDWLKEQRSPEKAEETFCYCHRRVLMVMPGVLLDHSEVPPAWGIFEYKGGRVYTKREPPLQEPVPLDYAFFAAVLRSAQETTVPREAVKALADAKVEEAVKLALERQQSSLTMDYHEERNARDAIDKFEKASGVRIDQWSAGNVGEAVNALLRARNQANGYPLRGAAKSLRDAAALVDAAVKAIRS